MLPSHHHLYISDVRKMAVNVKHPFLNLIFKVPCIMIQFMKITNKMQLCRIIYCSLTALHVLSDIFTHHQEHINCMYSFWYYSHVLLPADIKAEKFLTWIVPIQPRYQPATAHENNTRSCTYNSDAPDDERKYRSKHVQQWRNNKLSYTIASCRSFS